MFIFVFILFIDTVVNSVSNTVEGTKNVANSAADTTKTYVDNAKGIATFNYFIFVSLLLILTSVLIVL